MKISFEESDLEQLVDLIIERLESSIRNGEKNSKPKWIGTTECMQMLGIKSKTTLAKLRNEADGIRFSQPHKKIIVYDADSVLQYLEKHARNPF